MELGK